VQPRLLARGKQRAELPDAPPGVLGGPRRDLALRPRACQRLGQHLSELAGPAVPGTASRRGLAGRTGACPALAGCTGLARRTGACPALAARTGACPAPAARTALTTRRTRRASPGSRNRRGADAAGSALSSADLGCPAGRAPGYGRLIVKRRRGLRHDQTPNRHRIGQRTADAGRARDRGDRRQHHVAGWPLLAVGATIRATICATLLGCPA